MLQQLITEHIDLWTSAETKRSTTGRGSNKKIELTGIKKLRELILELAVRGLLVSQDPNDEPASVLLEKIAAEKDQLIKNGKLKKQKLLSAINDNEKLHVLPNGWQWAKLGHITDFVNGYAFKSSDFTDKGIGIVKIGDIQNGQISLASMSKVNKSIASKLDDSFMVKHGEMLIAMSGATTGKLGFNTTDEDFYINQRVGKIVPFLVSVKFLYHPLTTKIQDNLSKSMGSAIPNLSTTQIKDIVIALPPLNEQHRIVAKVDELMNLCDQLEQQQTEHSDTHHTLVTTLLESLSQASDPDQFQAVWSQLLVHFDTLFTTEASIDQLKQTILQLAVKGKLARQDPRDEPASILLKKIAAEKVRLIKDGKIKKQKPLPKITDDEKPFILPDSWKWERIGNYSLSTEYGSSEKTIDISDGVPVLKMGDIQNGNVILGQHKSVPSSIDELPELYLDHGDILYNRTNSAELVGKTGIYLGKDNKYTFASYLIRIRCHKKLTEPAYLNIAMNTPLFRETQIIPHLKQQCGQANVNGTIMKNMLVPIVPTNEQHRIVAIVDELMALCDQLKTQLNQAQTTQQQLANTLTAHATT